MSGAGTTAFNAAWFDYDPADPDRVTLAKIELSVPSALTLRYATAECHTPDGSTWQSGLEVGEITAGIDWLGPGMSPVDASIRLAKMPDAAQSGGALGTTNQDLLPRYLFQNAIVTIYLWRPSLTSFSDALQVFKGKVSRPVAIDPTGFTLLLLQDQSWNVQTPPTVVDKTSYPDSPDVSQGLPVPIVYGDHSAPAMPPPWASSFGSKSKQEDAGAGRGGVPLVLVDAGVGAAAVKVVAAGHECADVLDRTTGHSAFISGAETLSPLDTAGITEVLGATESYLSIADESALAYAAVIPMDVRTTAGNTADNPRRAMDPFDPLTFATLNQTTGKSVLQLILPNLGALGRIESVEVSVAFIGNAGNTQNLRIDAWKPGVGAGGGAAITGVSTGTTPSVLTGTWPATYWDQTWQFGGGNATAFDLRVDFAGAVANNKASIIWAVLVVKYRPQRSLVTPGGLLLKSGAVNLGFGSGFVDENNFFARSVPGAFTRVATQMRLDGQFYGNVKGYKDDGSGTYTGSASALIERPPDIIRHFLVTYGSVAGGNIETGAGVMGSFVDARSVLRNAQPADLKLACWIGDRTTVQRVVQKTAAQSGMAVVQDRFSDKWLSHVWKPGAAEDYGYKFSWHDMFGVTAEEKSVVEARRATRVKYGYDHFKGSTLYEAFVNPTGSGQGLNLPTTRDQRLTITTGVNDKLDFKYNQPPVPTLTTYAVTLDAGTYTGIDLAVELQGKMRTATGTTYMNVGYGFTIKTGHNDKLDFIVGGTPYQATLNPGDYTAEGLATEAARAMNAVAGHGLTFSWVYTHSTNKFTVSAASNFQVDGSVTCAGFATSALHVLGEYTTTVAAASRTMTVARYGDRLWFGSAGSATLAHFFNMLWGTGANLATNCAKVAGYTAGDSGLVTDNPATYSRGDRERISLTYDGYYDPREENTLTADWIRDEQTAVELRNRTFDLIARPRVVLKFNTHRVADIRRMQVIELQADVDPFVSYPKYGSDGSWAGKPMRVIQLVQRCGPDYFLEVLAVEA